MPDSTQVRTYKKLLIDKILRERVKKKPNATLVDVVDDAVELLAKKEKVQ